MSNYHFVNLNDLAECVVNVLKEEGQSFANYRKNVNSESVMDLCEEEGYSIAYSWAEGFKTYCNQKDTRIFGNFNNVKYDYEREFEGKSFNDILAKLNAEIDDEDTNAFKDWAIEWLFQTFGTFGLKYNFNDTLNAYFYEEIEEMDCNDAI